jgi:hypothetical protein
MKAVERCGQDPRRTPRLMRRPAHYLHWLLLALITLAGACGCTPGRTSAPAQLSNGFMGLADDEEGRLNDPESALNGFVDVSKVQLVDYSEYSRRKASGDIFTEEIRGSFVYFAVKNYVHVQLEYARAYTPVTERYKAPVPGKD